MRSRAATAGHLFSTRARWMDGGWDNTCPAHAAVPRLVVAFPIPTHDAPQRQRRRVAFPFSPWHHGGLYPAMIGGGLGVPRHHAWRGTPFHAGLQGATWPLHPATMHGGVQCNCPAMHGGGAKRASFKKTFNSGSNLKYVSNLG
jgi:hypothetical protein